MKVTILYNGIKKDLLTSANETNESLLVRALLTFHPPRSLVTVLGLFDKEGFQLHDLRSIAESRVKDGDTLLMRPTVLP